MIENIIGFKLPKDDLFSDDPCVRKFVFKFNVKASPNSSKIVGPNGNEKNYNRGLDEFCMFNYIKLTYFLSTYLSIIEIIILNFNTLSKI